MSVAVYKNAIIDRDQFFPLFSSLRQLADKTAQKKKSENVNWQAVPAKAQLFEEC